MVQVITLPPVGRRVDVIGLFQMLSAELAHTERCCKVEATIAQAHPCRCLQERLARLLCEASWTVQLGPRTSNAVLNTTYSRVAEPIRDVLARRLQSGVQEHKRFVHPRLLRVLSGALLLWQLRKRLVNHSAPPEIELRALVEFGSQYPMIPAVVPIISAAARVEHQGTLHAVVLTADKDARLALSLYKESVLAVTRPGMVFFHLGIEATKGGQT